MSAATTAMRTEGDDVWPALAVLGVLLLTGWRVAGLWLAPMDLSYDEAQYWFWSLSFDWGYYSKPPMVAWAIAASTSLCGDGEACIRLSSPLAHGVTGLLLIALGRALYGPREGAAAGLLYALLPGVSVSGMLISTDPFLLMFWALALLAFVKAERSDGLGWWVLLGVAVGLGMLSKYAMAAFVAGLVLYVLWSPELRWQPKRPGPWVALVVAGLVYLPNFLWNQNHGFVSYVHTGDNANLRGELFHPDELGEFLGAQFGVAGPVVFAVFLWLLFQALRGKTPLDDRDRLLLSAAIPMLTVVTVIAFLSRANANWAAVTYVSASVLVAAWLVRSGTRRRLRAGLYSFSVALGLLVLGGALHGEAILRAAAVPLTAKLDPFKHVRGRADLARQLAAVRQEHGSPYVLFEERKVLTPWLYYGDDRAAALKWNANVRIDDHFDMIMPVTRRIGETMLLATRFEDGARLAPSFTKMTRLGSITAPVYNDDSGPTLHLFLMEEFRGYDPPAVQP